MAKTNNQRRRRGASNWPLYALAGVAAVAAEGLTFALLWRQEPDHTIGTLYSLLTCSFSLLGLVASRSAALLKADSRPSYAGKAFAARVMSFALILPGAFVGGGAMAMRMEDRAAVEFAGSAAYAATLADAKDQSLDSQVRAQAAADLGKAIRPSQVRMDDPAYLGAVIAFLALLLLPVLAIGHAQTAAPETDAQRKRREAAIRAAKAAATKTRNAKIAARVRPTKPFSLVQNLR